LGFTLNLLAIPPILFALCFHEFSHAYVAYRLGDPTAASLGRLTLNPLKHLDPVGTLLLFFAGFGWAKPVPVDPRRLSDPRRHMLWIAAAGPGSNLLLALASGILLRLGLPAFRAMSALGPQAADMLWFSVQINLVLAFFNLIPLRPLDGSTVLKGILPLDQATAWARVEHVGPVILLALIASGYLFGHSLLWTILDPPVRFLSSLFTFGLV
jgi:Zn-dependent protease